MIRDYNSPSLLPLDYTKSHLLTVIRPLSERLKFCHVGFIYEVYIVVEKEKLQSMNTTTKRYHPIMVVLHWLTVVLILGAGFLSEDEGGGSSPINIHMILGSLLLATMIVRLIFRFTTKRPEWAGTGNEILNKLGELVHVGLYFFAFYILALGGLIAVKRNLIGYALGNGSVTRLSGFIGPLHQLGWLAIMGLLVLHIGGAVYHQFILKDNLLSRMGFGKS